MRKGIIKAIVLIAVFVVTVVVISTVTHKSNIDLTTKMKETTLPMVSLYNQDIPINELYGYTKKMDGTAMRDTITPLGEDLKLSSEIATYQNEIQSISYEVRSIDMERLIEENKVDSFSQENGKIQFSMQFQNILEEGIEYMLLLTIECDGEPVYYYTRITRESQSYVKESLDFIQQFHEQTFSRENTGSLATYLNPNKEGDNTTLQRVTLNSSLDQVTWGGFVCERMGKPIPSIKEVGSSYNTIVLNYVVTATGEDKEVEYYNVEEYYRVRYSSSNSRTYLLNYERTLNQIFRGENGIIEDNELFLGIRSEDVDYVSNESESVIAFVQEGELWSYSREEHKFFRIFSFNGAEGISQRENNQQHQIKIIRIDETGSMDFVVYGYMNRGKQEGKTGISVFHYDSVGNTIEEELFISSDKSYEMLKADWVDIFYVSDGNIFYLLVQDSLYRIDLYTRSKETVISGLKEDNYTVSENGRFVAWKEEDQASPIKIMDLEGEEVRTIQAEAGESVNPVGFVQSDFVYGIARETDAVIDGLGNTRFPMYRIQIVDQKSKVIKDSQKEGYYISKAYVEDETIFLDREIKTETGYAKADQSTIKNQQIEASRSVSVETVQTEIKQRQVQFTFKENIQDASKQLQTVIPKEILVQEKRTITLESVEEQETYYVYSGGEILLATHSIAEAVASADKDMGVVIGDKQKYIWCRGRKSSQPVVGNVEINVDTAPGGSIGRCLTALLQTEEINLDVEGLLVQGESPKQILTEALEGRKVIDLTGCSIDQVLYYVNLKTPIFSIVDNEAILVVGYDAHNTILYNPETNSTYKMGLQDSEEMFRAAGNIFLGYIE